MIYCIILFFAFSQAHMNHPQKPRPKTRPAVQKTNESTTESLREQLFKPPAEGELPWTT
jgi:hypothetical protein